MTVASYLTSFYFGLHISFIGDKTHGEKLTLQYHSLSLTGCPLLFFRNTIFLSQVNGNQTFWMFLQEWMSVGRTLVDITLGQLTAISLQPLDSVEARAHFLSLMGKYFKLLAEQEDPLCVWNLWDRRVTTVSVTIRQGYFIFP